MNKEKLAHEISEMQQRLAEMEDELAKGSGDEFEEGQWVHAEGAGFGEYVWRYRQKDKGVYFKNRDGYADVGPSNGMMHSTMRPATPDEIKEALVAEAKRRGYPNAQWITNHPDMGPWTPVEDPEGFGGDLFQYDATEDALQCKGHTCYYQGQWAEPIEDTVTINGVECEVGVNFINLSCGDSVHVGSFRNFYELVRGYALTVIREGEDITPQIKKLGEQI